MTVERYIIAALLVLVVCLGSVTWVQGVKIKHLQFKLDTVSELLELGYEHMDWIADQRDAKSDKLIKLLLKNCSKSDDNDDGE